MLIKGDSTVFKVNELFGSDIIDLKKLVHQERENGALRDVDAKDLVLWEVCGLESIISFPLTPLWQLELLNKPISAKPSKTVASRLKSLASSSPSFYAVELEDKALDVFLQSLLVSEVSALLCKSAYPSSSNLHSLS